MDRRSPAEVAIGVAAIAPALLVVGILLGGSLVFAAMESLGWGIGDGKLSFAAYTTIVAEPGFAQSVGLSLFVATASTALTIVLAVATALALRRVTRGRRILFAIYELPLTLPHLVVGVALISLLSQSGLLARSLTAIGVIDTPGQFPALIYDRFGFGIILLYAWKQVPFIGLFALSVLQSIGEDYEEVARSLGARRAQVVRHVLIPLLLPAIIPGSIIIFAFSFGAFEVPLLLGNRFPSMLSVLAYRLYTDVDLLMRPCAMAMSLFIAAISLGLVAIYRRVLNRGANGG